MDVDPRFNGLHAFKSATEALASLLQPKPEPEPAPTQPEPDTPEVITVSPEVDTNLPTTKPVQQIIDSSAHKTDFSQLLTNWADKSSENSDVATSNQPVITPEPIANEVIEADTAQTDTDDSDSVAVETVTLDNSNHPPSQFIQVDSSQSDNLEKLLNPWMNEKQDEEVEVKEKQEDQETVAEQTRQVPDIDLSAHPKPNEIDIDKQQKSFHENLLASLPINKGEGEAKEAPVITSSNWVSQPTIDVQDSKEVLLPQKEEQAKVAKVAETPPKKYLFEHHTIDFDPRKSDIFNSLPIKVKKQIAQRVNAQLSAQWTARQTIDVDKNTSAFILAEDNKNQDSSSDKAIISTANAQAPNLVLNPATNVSINTKDKNEERSLEEIDTIIEAIKAEGRRMLQKQDEARLSALRQDATMLAAFDDIAADLQKSINTSIAEEQLHTPKDSLKKADEAKIKEQQLLQKLQEEKEAEKSEMEDRQRLKDLLEEIELKSYHYSTSFEANQLGENNNTAEQPSLRGESDQIKTSVAEDGDEWYLVPVELLGPGVARWLGDVVGGVVETGIAAKRVVTKHKDSNAKLLSPPTKNR
ncbi:MAG: hypothetical protein HQL69_08165 [Magnetococcales bacterium]|nr:hypothetical protein [Magnetococcales bacterium]